MFTLEATIQIRIFKMSQKMLIWATEPKYLHLGKSKIGFWPNYSLSFTWNELKSLKNEKNVKLKEKREKCENFVFHGNRKTLKMKVFLSIFCLFFIFDDFKAF